MHPWYRGWTGEIIDEFADKEDKVIDKFTMRGKFEVEDEKTIMITELPPGVWTEDYRDELNKWVEDNNSKAKDKEVKSNRPDITLVNDFSDNDTVQIRV